MKRRQFVKSTAIFTTGALVFSETEIHASISKKESDVLDLKPLVNSKDKISINGFVRDFETLQPITNAKMNVSVKRNRFFPTYRELNSKNGSYTINSGFTNSGKISEKLEIKIIADGYKTYIGYLYLTKNGCNLHSSEWDYNPKFNPEYCPKNNKSFDETTSKFNFHLIKE
ncbi:hypothetical protein E0I61_11865 [Flavobacterium ranwuense]|uniref:Uncharacterized protein n=1 Tax=Flavobacterium ranwuense TaxID=2541725 RepID=A0ABY2DPI8_9FLAO|nr:hypothetical protein [Flavobacterium ranwuense]TDE28225.1 hypothetical protein E0I61_11865 [Flavobacterium ranwuense]